MAALELKGERRFVQRNSTFFQMDLYSNIAKHTMNLETLVTRMTFEQTSETRQSLGFFHWLYFVDCVLPTYMVVRHMYVLANETRRGRWILSDWSFKST